MLLGWKKTPKLIKVASSPILRQVGGFIKKRKKIFMNDCPKCKNKLSPVMRRDSLGKRYYEVCSKCGYEREIKKLGPKKRKG